MTLILGMLRPLIPDAVAAFIARRADAARGLLQGETARVIGYGGALVMWFVAHLVKAIPDISFDQAVLQAGAVMALIAPIIEGTRRYVSSPATVARIVASPPTAAGPINAAAAAGVDPALIGQALVAAPDEPMLDAAAVAGRLDKVGAVAGEGPVDESLKGAPLPESDVDEPEPTEDLPDPEADQ